MSKEHYFPKTRFSDHVEYYVKYRPQYPKAVLDLLRQNCGLNSNSVIADIGSGTGIFTKLLLETGNPVFGVEPNEAMRQAGENYLSAFQNFRSVNGSAESTMLADHSVDIITAAQAFHWFNLEPVKKEFQRILKPNGVVVLLWNLRCSEHPGIMQAYEALLNEFGIDYQNLCAENIDEAAITAFFKPTKVNVITLPNEQVLDWKGFEGRLRSTSYLPKEGAPNFEAMLNAAKSAFEENQQDGFVTIIYETKLYIALAADFNGGI